MNNLFLITSINPISVYDDEIFTQNIRLEWDNNCLEVEDNSFFLDENYLNKKYYILVKVIIVFVNLDEEGELVEFIDHNHFIWKNRKFISSDSSDGLGEKKVFFIAFILNNIEDYDSNSQMK